MARDSLYGETIVWSGRPKTVRVPPRYKIVAAVSAVVAVVTVVYAIVVATALHIHVEGMLFFAGWCALIALGAWRIPIHWRSQVEYLVTDRHVIWRRGRVRRSIERAQISYALIRWDSSDRGMGDLVLERAVPTGALRRTLSVTLADVEAPDRLWAIVRGVEPCAPLGTGDRPLAQRLDAGERVLWSAIPLASRWTARRAATAAIGVVVGFLFLRSILRGVPPITRLFRAHALPPSMLALVVFGAALGSLLLLVVTIAIAYSAIIRPARLAQATRYFVTNARVLIRRGNEELHLDRSRIAYVIDAPSHGFHDVFLVIDGPQARAFAPSGAFGGDDAGVLRPVFSAIHDAERVHQILTTASENGPPSSLPKAA